MKQVTNSTIINQWSTMPTSIIENFGEQGDAYRQFLLNPAIFSLIGNLKGQKVLDAGCGQGYLSRMMSKQGAKVVGVEPATQLINYAIKREQTEQLGIEYITQDLSTWQAPSADFDICIANMVFMDIPTYQDAMRNCVAALKPGGIFVYSIIHPCFEESVDWSVKQSVETTEYFAQFSTPQTYSHFFHRKLSDYINYTIELGCNIQQIIEPQLVQDIAVAKNLNQRNLHIPSFIVIKSTKIDS